MLNALRKDNSPFSEQQISALQAGLRQIDANQTAWLSGYLAGRLAQDAALAGPIESAGALAAPSFELDVFYGSQTGNGEQIALQLASGAAQLGLSAPARSLNDLRPAALKKVRHAVFIISTHGEGDPPDDALDLFEFLQRPNAPRLDKLRFRILALGDSTYSQFCAAGRQLEELLLAGGASKFADRLEVDLDFEEPADQWVAEVLEFGQTELKSRESEAGIAGTANPALSSYLSVVPDTSKWQRKNPFPAEVQQIQKITGLESGKDVYHLELSLEGSGLNYQPGDSLGVWAYNAPELVSAVLSGLGIDESSQVDLNEQQWNIFELLRTNKELTRLSPDAVAQYAERTGSPDLPNRLQELDDKQKQAFIEQRQFIDLVEEFPARLTAQELADLLRPLAPRSYSIASSQAMVDEEVHLTVASLRSNAIGVERTGVASDLLNHQLQPGDEVGVFLEPNTRFHLPQDTKAPLILVAAGTGVAPYRAFLQHLEEQGSTREIWLIFGNPHLRTDFLYQREWLNWRSSGLISRIDGAFSRDQEEKRYVQHIISEQAEEVNSWLGRGAYVYICGALKMGHSVETALKVAVSDQCGLDEMAGIEFMSGLRRERRLLKDLY